MNRPPTGHSRREHKLLRVELARPVDMFEKPPVVLGSVVGGFAPGVESCVDELMAHHDQRPVEIAITVPAAELTPELPAAMQTTLRRWCDERILHNQRERVSLVRSGLRALRVGLPVSLLGLLITAVAAGIGDVDDSLRAVVDIIGWTLAWVGLWYPFDKMLFYPYDVVRENRALTSLREANLRFEALEVDAPV